MIKGISIELITRTKTGTDALGNPIYEDAAETVENVIVSPIGSTEQQDILNLTGRKATYTLCIPKGDAHAWEDAKVKFFGETWHVFGIPTEYIDDMTPLSWNKKVTVERYE